MEEEKQQETAYYRVTCVWCGIVIRLDKMQDMNGMCLKCFDGMLKHYIRAQARATNPLTTSDR